MMIVLRLTQSLSEGAGHPVEIALEGKGVRQTATTVVASSMTPADEQRLRWYMEDYPERNADPAPRVAASIEHRMKEIGGDLFKQVFEKNRDVIKIWSMIGDELADVRIEISTGIKEAHSLPWELLRDPRTDTPLALAAAEFVRVQSQAGRVPRTPPVTKEAARILMVICRPAGADDVPFRSVAIHIVKALTDVGAAAVVLEVLRPPTFPALGRTLRRAKDEGKPFHAVHFDGHGLYIDDAGLADLKTQSAFDPRRLSAPAAADTVRGYICFEDKDHPSRMEAVDGTAVGNLLYEAQVPTLVLNACRSGFGAPAGPPPAEPAAQLAQEDQVRAYGSFAQAVVDAGATGVVAMRYNVYVATAAQFVGEFYQSLAQGQTLGRAATRARKHLGDERTRAVAGEPLELQDWPVPAIYEAAPIALFPKRDLGAPLFDETDWTTSSAESGGLPRPPDVGFVGRDETLLAIDRAFDSRSVILLQASAGSGKTTTAAEFARWYSVTSGVKGPVLFSSFEQRLPLSRVLDRIGTAFAPVLEASRVPWLTLDDDQRRRVAIKLLESGEVLWIWDNVEQVAGFPTGAESAWTSEEQESLAEFLRDVAATKAKVLLTSRRDERRWLGDLPLRVRIPPMSWRDRRLLATAIVQRQGHESRVVEALEPLLEFSQGNPLTLSVVVRQALHDGIATHDAAAGMKEQLQAGEDVFDDHEEQGRSRSLGASLAYGFDRSFGDSDRRRLALLHLFQGLADSSLLAQIERAADGTIDGGGFASDEDWRRLLDRAAEIGLLTKVGGHLYSVHPALPWYFKAMFETAYPSRQEDGQSPSARIQQLFALSIVIFCTQKKTSAEDQVIERAIIRAHEANLLHVRRLADRNSWWDIYFECTRILTNFYDDAGRRAEAQRIVDAAVDKAVDRQTMAPKAGMDDYWPKAISMAHARACDSGSLSEAEGLLNALETHLSTLFGSTIAAIAKPVGSPRHTDAVDAYLHAARVHIGTIVGRKVVELLERAAVLGESAYNLAIRLDETWAAGAIAMHLGHCYVDMRKEPDLDMATTWYERAIRLYGEYDERSLSMCRYELAQVKYRKFQWVNASTASVDVKKAKLDDAFKAAMEAKRLQPDGYPRTEMILQLLIGNILDDGGYFFGSKDMQEHAAVCYEKAIQMGDDVEDPLTASTGCREMARLKVKMGEFDEALIYARSSLDRAGKAGPKGTHIAELSAKLIAAIEHMRRNAQGGPG